MKTLLDLYKSHSSKVSDKWALYLREYDRLFAPYRDQAISILEIGVQNGGSLEIWSQYFPNAQKFVGCDINPDCAALTYTDPRITVIVGDATAPETHAKVLDQSASFDLIIDDGSHTSSDIVKAFARYFPVLKKGGLFVCEDLHCSYWQEYEGGIFHPYSSITFFKHLADMVNREHWGIEKNRTDLIAGFKNLLGVDFDESILGQITSVEFINSICVVRKNELSEGLLGERVIAGSIELVVGGLSPIAGTHIAAPNQSLNSWSNLTHAPAETYQELVHEINETKDLVAQLRSIAEAKEAEVAHLSQLVSAMQGSRSWRYTGALRRMGTLARPAVKLLRRIKSAARQDGGYAVLAGKVINVLRREGWQGLRWRLSNAQIDGLVVKSDGQTVDRNDYQTWIKLYDTLDSKAIEGIKAEIASFSTCPKISVVMPVYNAQLDFLKQAIESVQVQLYPHWELCIAADVSSDAGVRPLLESFSKTDQRIKVVFLEKNCHSSAVSNTALDLVTGEFVALLGNDDRLTIDALFWVAHAIYTNAEAKLIYSDEDKIDHNGARCEPFFKPDWSPHLAISQAYLDHLVVFSVKNGLPRFSDDCVGAQNYELWLSIANQLSNHEIVHISKILYHWRKHPELTVAQPDSKIYAAEAGRRAVDNFIKNKYSEIAVGAEVGLNLFTYKPVFKIPDNTLVSIIIPTKDGIDFLEVCVDSIINKTKNIEFEIIILNNNSIEPRSFEYFREIQNRFSNVKVIDAPIKFNWSRLNNIGVEVAKGDVYVFLNNDTKVIDADWLTYLSAYSLLPDVGLVGGLLLFEDGTIQHSGVVVGMGGWADHVYRTSNPLHTSGNGYVSPVLTRNVLAVTGACMAISRSKYELIGAFDENFIICGSDVEICIRAYKKGFYNVMCAESRLYHFESKTRTPHVPDIDFEQSKIKYEPYRLEKIDPFYNRNLSLFSNCPTLSEVSRVV